jgi:hypothetical protein
VGASHAAYALRFGRRSLLFLIASAGCGATL